MNHSDKNNVSSGDVEQITNWVEDAADEAEMQSRLELVVGNITKSNNNKAKRKYSKYKKFIR